ncbi:MAG: glycosyltransferase family 9 protein [Flavobacteriaceae bacterium]|nr:glycosyltransferase family 9 protein [Flavobacteriaceae bacterium]
MSLPFKHILVIRLSAMGDVAMLVPVIRALSSAYPELKITILTRPFFKPLFDDLQKVSVFEIDLKDRHKGLFGLWKLSRDLNHIGIEAIADCHDVLRSNVLKIFMQQYPFYQIDKGRSEKKALTSGQIFKPLKSTHQRYADVFQSMKLPVTLEQPEFPEGPDIPDKVKPLLGEYSKLIGIAPFAAYESKEYPLEKMEEVITELSEDATILLFGGREDKSRLKAVADNHSGVITLAGIMSFVEELKIIRNLNLMISMDSGNAHLSAAYGIPTITVWGVTHPYAGFSPFHQDPSNAILADRSQYPEIPTSVYGNKYPGAYRDAIATIDPLSIVRKARQIIKHQTSS